MAEQTASHANASDTSWPVKMAQYVPPASAEALASVLPFFKKRRAARLPGTWLSSKSSATVTLSSASPSGLGPFIAVILQGHVHEEHFLSTLAFTWPSFQDENGNTSSPGRVILASYKKICTDEKHKFAMQFETVLQAEGFFKTVKQLIAAHSEALKDFHNDDNERMDYPTPVSQVENSKNAQPLGMNAAIAGHCGNLRALYQAMRTKNSTNVLPLSELSVNVGAHGEQGRCTVFNKKNSPLILPPRFPALDLQSPPLSEQQKGENPTIIGEGLHNEQNMQEKIKAYLLDPEFQDFVDRVEKIVHAMEVDLATEISSVQS